MTEKQAFEVADTERDSEEARLVRCRFIIIRPEKYSKPDEQGRSYAFSARILTGYKGTMV